MTQKIHRFKGSHYEIGVQHGSQLRSIISNNVIPFVETEMKKLALSNEGIRRITKRYEDLIGSEFPEVIDEAKGLAEGAELDYETAMMLLFFWEVRDTVSHSKGASVDSTPTAKVDSDCSSFVAAGDATVDGMPIATQNSDWPLTMHGKGLAQVFHISPDNRYRFIGRGLAGNLGRNSVIGFNEKGLAFVGSGIVQFRDADFGFPPLIITRLGLERCSSVDEFVQLVRRIPYYSHAGENVDVVDREGNMARISFSTKRVMTIQTKNHFVVSTNHYHNPEMRNFGPRSVEDYMSTFKRYERLVELAWDNHGSIDRSVVQSIMSDHKYGDQPPDGNNSICRHGETHHTLSNMISLPSLNEFWISEGNPCKGNYTKYCL